MEDIHIYDIYGNQIDDGKSGWKIELVDDNSTIENTKKEGDDNGSK